MFKSVKKANSNPKDNMDQAALTPCPLRERVTRTCRVRGDKKQTNSMTSRLFSSSLSVILRRERSELSGESRNIKAILFDEANSVFSRFLNVITGFIPVILVQRVTNLVNKFALLLHKYRFSQDSRDRLCVTPENDGCWSRGCSVFNASALNVILERERSELSRGSRNIMAIFLNAANSMTSRLFSSSLSVILRRERSELSGESRNIKAILFDEANSVFSRFLNVITGFIPVILVQRVTNLVNKLAILSNGANSTTSRLFSGITGFIQVILVQQVISLVNKFAVLLHKYRFRQDCRNTSDNDSKRRVFDTCCNAFKYPSPEADASTSPAGGEVLNSVFNASALNVMLRSKPSVTIKSAVIFSAFMLFSAAAQATVCFLPDGNCGDVNYGYKGDSGANCTYRTQDEANKKKGECEEVKKQGFCYYLSCSMSKSDCDKAAANAQNHDKCCVTCGNCWKVDDCVNPPIPTCEGAGYETEQTCKNNNQNFEPNGKFDKSGTACGTCKDVPYITCPEMGDDYITRAECTAKGSGFTFNYAEVKDSDGNECGTCSENETCPSGYSTAYQTAADCPDLTGQKVTGVIFNGKFDGKACGLCQYDKKTCADYNYKAAGECGSGYTEQPIFTSNAGKQCVLCHKIETCTYKYYEATANDTHGVTGNLDANWRCAHGTECFNALSEVESIDIRQGYGAVMPIYNKISNKSDSCVTVDGKTYYETLCTGTAKELCPSSKKFTPNGCVSNTYNHAYEVKGTQWGTCECDTAQGSYSTEADCKNNMSSDEKCSYRDGCYVRHLPGFSIQLQTEQTTFQCSKASTQYYQQNTIGAFLQDENRQNPADTNGRVFGSIGKSPDRYFAGEYYICSGAYGGAMAIEKTYVKDGSGGISMCFGNGCNKEEYTENGASCHSYTFEEGRSYVISLSYRILTDYSCN